MAPRSMRIFYISETGREYDFLRRYCDRHNNNNWMITQKNTTFHQNSLNYNWY